MKSIEEEKKLRGDEDERLRNILKELGVREKLNKVREEIWKEGEIEEVVIGPTWTKANVVEIRLVTDYVDLTSRPKMITILDDPYRIYPNRTRRIDSGKKEYIESVSVAALVIGATSINAMENVGSPATDLYIGFRTVDRRLWVKGVKVSSLGWLERERKAIGIGAGKTDLVVSQFIDKHLLEFTANKFLPSNLKGRVRL